MAIMQSSKHTEKSELAYADVRAIRAKRKYICKSWAAEYLNTFSERWNYVNWKPSVTHSWKQKNSEFLS